MAVKNRETAIKARTDCFAYRGERCNALKKLECADGRTCSFYMTAEEFEKRRRQYPAADTATRKRPGR